MQNLNDQFFFFIEFRNVSSQKFKLELTHNYTNNLLNCFDIFFLVLKIYIIFLVVIIFYNF